MSDLDISGTDVIGWLWTTLITVLGWLGLRAYLKVDNHTTELAILKATVVTHEQLQMFKQEQRESLEELRESLVATMNLAVERVEKSNIQVSKSLQETQNLILQKLLEK